MTLRQGQVILLTVAEFAKLCQTTPRTIRFYQQLELLEPAEIDDTNNYRYFRPEQVRELAMLKLLHSFGLSLKQVKAVIQSNTTNRPLEAELQRLEDEIKTKKTVLRFLTQANEVFFHPAALEAQLKEETIGPLQLFCLSVENGDHDKIGEYIKRLREAAAGFGISCADDEITFYREYAYHPKRTPLEIALICTSRPNPKTHRAPFYFRTMEATRALTFAFTGPWNYLPLVHQKLDEIVERRGVGHPVVFERYLKNPLNTATPYAFETKIGYILSAR